MIEALISMLIYICILALVVYVVIWVLGQIGIALPPQVIKILWIIVALIVLLMLVRLVLSGGLALPGIH